MSWGGSWNRNKKKIKKNKRKKNTTKKIDKRREEKKQETNKGQLSLGVREEEEEDKVVIDELGGVKVRKERNLCDNKHILNRDRLKKYI